MPNSRQCGILLHPTSLPSIYGIGDMGKEAYKFVDFLQQSHQTFWQILPLNPVGYGWSPYQGLSAFAGNSLLISIDKLLEEKLLVENEIEEADFPPEKVDFTAVTHYKEKILRKAFQRFEKSSPSERDYFSFLEKNKFWLDDYSLFMALKEHFNGLPWNLWKSSIANRNEKAIKHYEKLLDDRIRYHKFLQYIFFKQWRELKNYANKKGIKIIGDAPIYVAYDSSDVWKERHLFKLDSSGNPIVVAGVPPDYFSKTGQLWGNPIYRWNKMKQDNYLWWRNRLEKALEVADFVRIDHFRGFEAYWEVPTGEKTAVKGKWVKGPGEDFFKNVEQHLGKLPLIAEDLGFITEEVVQLRKKFGFPGMKVLQFAFEGGEGELLDALSEKDTVLYTGTHDNDTILGWYENVALKTPRIMKLIKHYFDTEPEKMSEEEICLGFIKIAYSSKAKKVILPLQDILYLDSSARMNVPGSSRGNWQWRFNEGCLDEKQIELLKSLVKQYRL